MGGRGLIITKFYSTNSPLVVRPGLGRSLGAAGSEDCSVSNVVEATSSCDLSRGVVNTLGVAGRRGCVDGGLSR